MGTFHALGKRLLATAIVGGLMAGFGGPAGAQGLIQLSNVAGGIGGFAIDGETTGNESGLAVAGAGDVNGDGLADVIVGAPLADFNGMNSGRSYVIFGKAGGTTVTLAGVVAGNGGFAISGEATGGDSAGFNVSKAGDVNGDGLADAIVGNYRFDGVGIRSGRACLVFGKTSGAVVSLADVAAGTGGGFAMDGESASDTAGLSVSGAGDVNGDGLDDVIVGASLAATSGAGTGHAYVVFGKTDVAFVPLAEVAGGTGGFVIKGEGAIGPAGRWVSGAGDVNGDGLPDLIVGAHRADPNGGNSGRSYVVYNPLTPPETTTYRAKSRSGDGPGGDIVKPTTIDNARVTVDFSDEDAADNGSGGASLETVTSHRSAAGIENIAPVADVAWEIATDRTGFAAAEITFKFTDAEITGLGDESDLSIFKAESISGPWTQLESTVDTARNTISATVDGFSFFVIGGGAGGGHAQAANWIEYR